MAASYVVYKKLRFPKKAGFALLFFGSYLPDLMDKTCNLIFNTPARGYFHSAVVLSAIFGLVGGLAKLLNRWKASRNWILGLWVLSLLHCVGDLPDLFDWNMFFWPFLDKELTHYGTFTPGGSLRRVYLEFKMPMTLFCEVTLLLYAGYLFLNFARPKN